MLSDKNGNNWVGCCCDELGLLTSLIKLIKCQLLTAPSLCGLCMWGRVSLVAIASDCHVEKVGSFPGLCTLARHLIMLASSVDRDVNGCPVGQTGFVSDFKRETNISYIFLHLHALPPYVLLIDPGCTRLGESPHSTQSIIRSGLALPNHHVSRSFAWETWAFNRNNRLRHAFQGRTYVITWFTHFLKWIFQGRPGKQNKLCCKLFNVFFQIQASHLQKSKTTLIFSFVTYFE